MKDIVTPVPPEETRTVIRKCLENAALVNYTQLSNEAKIDGKFSNFTAFFAKLWKQKSTKFRITYSNTVFLLYFQFLA